MQYKIIGLYILKYIECLEIERDAKYIWRTKKLRSNK